MPHLIAKNLRYTLIIHVTYHAHVYPVVHQSPIPHPILHQYYGLSKLSPPTETHSIQTTSRKIRSSKIPHFFQIHNLDCLTRKICVIHIDLIFLLSLMDHFRSQQGYKGEDSKDGEDWPLTSLSPRLIVASRRCRVLLSSRLAVASCHRISLLHLAFTFRCHISSLCQFLSLHLVIASAY